MASSSIEMGQMWMDERLVIALMQEGEVLLETQVEM
jgi:hypothetical protein